MANTRGTKRRAEATPVKRKTAPPAAPPAQDLFDTDDDDYFAERNFSGCEDDAWDGSDREEDASEDDSDR